MLSDPIYLNALGSLLTALTVIISAIAAYFAYRASRRSRNLTAFFELSKDFRDRWEGGWEQILRERAPALSAADRRSGEVGRQLRFMLNWVDWVSTLVRKDLIDRDLIFSSLGAAIKEMIIVSADLIENDEQDPAKGPKWWANIRYMAVLPEIDVDIAKEAEKLRVRDQSEQAQAED